MSQGVAERLGMVVGHSESFPDEMILDTEQSGVCMGRVDGVGESFSDGYYVGKSSEEDGNVLAIGNSGSGKSHFIAKTILETWKEPIVALDFKGELSRHYISKYEEGKMRKLIVFNPMQEGMHYDPYEMLDRNESDLVTRIKEIAYAIIPLSNEIKDPFWRMSARRLLSAFLLYYYKKGLGFIESILCIHNNETGILCNGIIKEGDYDEKCLVNEMVNLKQEQLANIGLEMKEYLEHFTSNQHIQDALSNEADKKNSFSWKDLEKVDAPNIFLQLEQDKMEQLGDIARLMLTQLIRHLERRPDKFEIGGETVKPILLLLDEFPLLGEMNVISEALATLRSKKVTVCIMIQSLAQLDLIYGNIKRKIIVDNCQYKIMLKISEPDSQDYFSRLLGSEEILGSREPIVYPHEFATNEDIWLQTPYGFLPALKMSLDTTAQNFSNLIKEYYRRRRKKYDH